jgi:hypothetical protein
MATVVEIDDPADPRLGDYRDLRDVELRKHIESEHGLFLAEGASGDRSRPGSPRGPS